MTPKQPTKLQAMTHLCQLTDDANPPKPQKPRGPHERREPKPREFACPP